jgi:DeoR/GlpR family transcriptional regulator of sugar metabolism
MVCIADKVIVVTDSSKFGKKSFVRYAGVDAVHAIITDKQVNKQEVEPFRKKGIEVIIAE